MRTHRGWMLVPVLVALSGLLGGCGLFAGEPALSPQEVVTKFYRWYVGYPANPLVDESYRSSPYLSKAFVEEIDEALASLERGGADPFLLAQDIPERFAVGETMVSGDRAAVSVQLFWGGNPTPSERRVDLELIEGEWRITAISLAEP